MYLQALPDCVWMTELCSEGFIQRFDVRDLEEHGFARSRLTCPVTHNLPFQGLWFHTVGLKISL